MRRMDAVIRAFKPADRPMIRKIFKDTAFHSESYNHFFDDGEWLADIMTSGYTDFEPESSFVAEQNGDIIGYLTGTLDTARYERRWVFRILPRVALRFFSGGTWINARAWSFFLNGFKSGLKREQKIPKNLVRDYPAHFHINLSAQARGGGVGTKLAERFFAHMKSRDVLSGHVRTATKEPRQRFFASLGFQPLITSKLTLWKYLDPTPYYLIVYGFSLKK